MNYDVLLTTDTGDYLLSLGKYVDFDTALEDARKVNVFTIPCAKLRNAVHDLYEDPNICRKLHVVVHDESGTHTAESHTIDYRAIMDQCCG